jgi:hypothetical protein
MPGTGRRMLTIGAILVACISIFHIACAIVGPSAYRLLGAGEAMATAAATSAWPALLTLGLAAAFGLFSLYGFSAAGLARPLPLCRAVIIFIGAIFGLRGLAVVRDVVVLIRGGDALAFRNLFYSAVALLVALLYILGLVFRGGRNPVRSR